MILIVLRSILFQIAYISACTFWFVVASAAWFMKRGSMYGFGRGWARTILWLHQVIVGARVEFRGVERIPEGPLLFCAKHHSAWETMGLLLFAHKYTYILKQELLDIPLFGRHLKCAEQIPIDRSKGRTALARMLVEARERLSRGAQIIIFPEGTRRKAGAVPAYKFGAAKIYSKLGVACVPVALTSGLAWPRNTFLHYPRPILVEFLEPIPAGLDAETFQARMQEAIETNTDRLLDEAGFTAEERAAALAASLQADAAAAAAKASDSQSSA